MTGALPGGTAGGVVYVGLMSGTSLDGISAAVVRLRDDAAGRPHAELLGFTQRAYGTDQRARLARALEGANPAEYCRLNFDLGEWLAAAAATAETSTTIGKEDRL